jgi:hypothetical protein
VIALFMQCGQRALRCVYVNCDDTMCCACCKIVSTCNRAGVALKWNGDLAFHGDVGRL